MKNVLQFDFIPDKEKNTLTIRREFLAGRQLDELLLTIKV